MNSKPKTPEQLEAIEQVLNYILEFERDDFENHPSVSHVYYTATLAAYGPAEARKVYNEAIRNLAD